MNKLLALKNFYNEKKMNGCALITTFSFHVVNTTQAAEKSLHTKISGEQLAVF